MATQEPWRPARRRHPPRLGNHHNTLASALSPPVKDALIPPCRGVLLILCFSQQDFRMLASHHAPQPSLDNPRQHLQIPSPCRTTSDCENRAHSPTRNPLPIDPPPELRPAQRAPATRFVTAQLNNNRKSTALECAEVGHIARIPDNEIGSGQPPTRPTPEGATSRHALRQGSRGARSVRRWGRSASCHPSRLQWQYTQVATRRLVAEKWRSPSPMWTPPVQGPPEIVQKVIAWPRPPQGPPLLYYTPLHHPPHCIA